MSEENTNRNPRPEIRGKVIAVLPEWQNSAGTFVKREVIVETGYSRSTPIKVTFKNNYIPKLEGVSEGDAVIISYALDGRKWDGPNGTQYFNDIVGLDLQKIVGSGGAAAKPVLGCTFETAKATWFKYHGDDLDGFAEFCRQRRPDMVKLAAEKKMRLSDILKTRLDVCADIVNAIEAAQNAAAEAADEATDDENLPF